MNERHLPARWLGFATAILLAVQLIVFARGVLNGSRFASSPGLAAGVGIAGAVLFLCAIGVATGLWRPRSRTAAVVIMVLAIATTVRYHLPRLVLDHLPAERVRGKLAAQESPELVAFLRELASAQEQWRLVSGSYSSTVDSLQRWLSNTSDIDVTITARGDQAWSAIASRAGIACTIWVRDSALRASKPQPEGSPVCREPERREPWQLIPSVVLAARQPTVRFIDSDLSGSWLQHRADLHRTGVAPGESQSAGYRWDARVGGGLRSPAAIAGNQVFVGAHGNGELVALSLDSGKTGFRIRAPNWIHHEPAVTTELVIVGFGNNERVTKGNLGTAPSGVAAYDRRTGEERWRTYTLGSVMATPSIGDSVVAVATGAEEAVGMELRTGRVIWRRPVPGISPMSNPLSLDSLVLVSIEERATCVIDMRSGNLRYCASLTDKGGGAGHASPAVVGDFVLQVVGEHVSFEPLTTADKIAYTLKRILGIGFAQEPNKFGQVLVAFRLSDGGVAWRTPIGKGFQRPAGHSAGTPTVGGHMAYIPAAHNGNIVAIDTRSGRLAWSSPVGASRGSVSLVGNRVLSATRDTSYVVLDATTGTVACRRRLPARADRAGLTISGQTGVLTLGNGTVMARPLRDWLACRA